jgi:hypothetical protein
VGDNTSQKKDGNIGGEKFMVASDQRALIRSSFSDCHFTVLGFTAGDGNPVCCVIILSGTDLKANHIMGVQPWIPVEGDVTEQLEENSGGLDKFYPFGPKCFHNGHEISTYVTISENGSITSEILTNVMRHLDTYLQWDRTEAIPFVLLDGHGSHFGIDFLRYISDNNSKWTVCVGVPYGTHLWQVGDSAEQNGSFKMALIKAKQKIINEKARLRLPCKLERQDIVGLVHRAWNESFAIVENNKKAIRNRGWGPLTYNILDHPELQQQKKNRIIEAAYITCAMNGMAPLDPNGLNLKDGISGTLLENLMEQMQRQRARNTALRDNEEDIRQEHLNNYERSTRMTAGIAFNARELNLSNGSVLRRVEEIHRVREERVLATVQRREREDASEKAAYEAVKQYMADNNKVVQELNVSQLKALVKWFKRPGDSKLPGRRQELIQRYELTKGRVETDRNRKKDNEEAARDGDEENIAPLAMEALAPAEEQLNVAGAET